MKNKEYRKSYKPLIVWMLVFPFFMIISGSRVFNADSKTSVLAMMISMVISLYILMLIIYKGEYVYWINGGPSFEQAKAAGSERRKEYARAHLNIFYIMMLLSFLYGAVSFLLRLSIWLDIFVILMLVVVAAFKTIPIKFKEE